MSNSERAKSERAKSEKKSRLEQYLDTYIRNEMYESFKDYLLGKARKTNNKKELQISISMTKIIKITMIYHAAGKIKAKDLTDMLNTNPAERTNKALQKYYSIVRAIAKKIYTKHRMNLLRIEESFMDRGISEGPCLTMKLLYLTGVRLPDERGRYMKINTNKASLELGDLINKCNIQGSSEEYESRAYRYQMTKALKKAKTKADKTKADKTKADKTKANKSTPQGD